jgi:hypothetical protein
MNNYLYIGGNFTMVENDSGAHIAVTNFAILDPTRKIWNPDTGTLNSTVAVIRCSSHNKVYIGGVFSEATLPGGVTLVANALGIVKWSGSLFESVGFGVDVAGSPSIVIAGYPPAPGTGYINDIAFDKNDNIVVVGGFDTAGGRRVPSSVAVISSNIWYPYLFSYDGTDDISYIDKVISLNNGELIFITPSAMDIISTSIEIENVDSQTYPIIVITGPGFLSSIINRTNKRALIFNSDFYINVLEEITISFYRGGYTISSNYNRDVSHLLLFGSVFFLSKGDNIISTYMYSETDTDTAVNMMIRKSFPSLDGVTG